jgi:ketosteroid isomerase-like protein
MGSFAKGKGKEFYNEQLGYLGKNDIEGLLSEHYHPDAVMVTFDGIRRGRDELRKYFENTLTAMKKITDMKTLYFEETEDVILFKASITSEGRGTVSADNALYMKDGKIFRHLALTLLPNMDYEKQGTLWKN